MFRNNATDKRGLKLPDSEDLIVPQPKGLQAPKTYVGKLLWISYLKKTKLMPNFKGKQHTR